MKLTKDDLTKALDAIDQEDQERILDMAAMAVARVRERPARVMFGHWSALELIAKVGIYLNRKNINDLS